MTDTSKLIEKLRYEASEYAAVSHEYALLLEAADEIERLTAEKDGAYEERNKVVAALAKVFPSGIAKTDIPGWLEEWHGCVYIDLPTGQASWHYHDSQAYLFESLPPYEGEWDGHDTTEKYRRLAALPSYHSQWERGLSHQRTRTEAAEAALAEARQAEAMMEAARQASGQGNGSKDDVGDE